MLRTASARAAYTVRGRCITFCQRHVSSRCWAISPSRRARCTPVAAGSSRLSTVLLALACWTGASATASSASAAAKHAVFTSVSPPANSGDERAVNHVGRGQRIESAAAAQPSGFLTPITVATAPDSSRRLGERLGHLALETGDQLLA